MGRETDQGDTIPSWVGNEKGQVQTENMIDTEKIKGIHRGRSDVKSYGHNENKRDAEKTRESMLGGGRTPNKGKLRTGRMLIRQRRAYREEIGVKKDQGHTETRKIPKKRSGGAQKKE